MPGVSHPAAPTPLDRALALAARHVNVSTPIAIPEAELLRALRTGAVPARLAHHVHAVLDETDLETLTDLVLAGGATYGQLATLADRLLPPSHPTRIWLDERRAL